MVCLVEVIFHQLMFVTLCVQCVSLLMGKHTEWRKIAKKARRKRIRKLQATKRDELIKIEEEKKLQSPRYQQWLSEQHELEEFAAEQEKQIKEEREIKWIEDEKIAQEKWKRDQEILKEESLKRAQQEKLIKEEWEREQKNLKEEKEKKKFEEEARIKEREAIIVRMDAFINGELEEIPEELNVPFETQPGKPTCPFFAKTGACKFKNECSRNHIKPAISKTLLFPGFYTHFSLDGAKHTEYDTDISLEYEFSETYKHFLEFYNDVKYEFDKYGKLTQLKVCFNTSSHLKGNVYASFSTEREALVVYRKFNGRYYAGRPVSVEFTDIPLWKSAICGLQFNNKCPKGHGCNFLHVFKNPGRQFSNADKLAEKSLNKDNHDNWRWSESPPDNRNIRESHSRSHKRSKERTSSSKRRRSHSRTRRKRRRRSSRESRRDRSHRGSERRKLKSNNSYSSSSAESS